MNKLTQTYYYDRQIYRYLLQFMSIFSVFKVSVGRRDDREATLISVPIHYASQDRIASAIIAGNTQNAPIRLPAMSVFMRDVRLAPDRFHGTGVERRNVYTPVGGLVPNDMKVVHQRMPIPYDLELELTVSASNIDQYLQLLEQILSLFDPQLVIQTSDAPFDWARMTSVELTNISTDDMSMQDTSSRVIQSTLTFKMPIYLSLPADVRDDIVEKIFVRVGAVNTASLNDVDIIQQLDDAGFIYNKMFDANDLPFE